MFYSHEILTSRQYGVATVWLVATLGAKSNLKRIKRKQILDVDVTKACQTIIEPVAPMALRLQGNLLYGVSRVYLQQCGYVLSDAQNAHNAMRMMLRTVENLALDPDASKARPEHLILPDDPSFLPDFVLPPLPEALADFDLDLNFDIVRSGDSQSLTPFGSQQFRSSSQIGALGGLVLPSSSPSVAGSFRLLGGDEQAGSIALLGADNAFQLDDDPGFSFDDDGALIEFPSTKGVPGTPAALPGSVVLSDAGASAKVRMDHDQGRFADAQLRGDPMDIDLPIFGYDEPIVEASSASGQHQSNEHSEQIHSTSTASAHLRQRHRAARTLPVDSRMELRNKDLADWNANYVTNMEEAIRAKRQSRTGYQAKKAAEHFVWGSGLGDIGHRFRGMSIPSHFDLFIGDNLFELVTGTSRKKTAGIKHDRDSGIDDTTQDESRRVRQKTHEPEEEVARGLEDEGFSMPDEEVELPREAASALDDQQMFSAMPWNITASVRGSSAVPRSGLSVPTQGRPGSRMVSASPLLRRSQPLDPETLKGLESDGNMGFEGSDFGFQESSSPPTKVAFSPQVSTRVQEALSAEGENFLLFATDALAQKLNDARASLATMPNSLQDEATTAIDEITFEELLPPNENSRIVACQGLMMVLGLGTKGMLDVQQLEHFGDISLKLTEKAKASQAIEISDGSESEGDEVSTLQEEEEAPEKDEDQGELQDGGHFEEQFAAGHAGQQNDDRDSLYDD